MAAAPAAPGMDIEQLVRSALERTVAGPRRTQTAAARSTKLVRSASRSKLSRGLVERAQTASHLQTEAVRADPLSCGPARDPNPLSNLF